MKQMTDITSFEAACEARGLNPETVLPDFSMFPEQHRAGMLAHCKLVIISDALNDTVEGEDSDRVWYPVFYKGSPSGAGFAYYDFVTWYTSSSVGARLCYKSRELAKYAGNTFLELYKENQLLLPCEASTE